MLRVSRPLVGVTTICKTCDEEKDDSLFVHKHGKRVGRVCRECHGNKSVIWSRRNPEAAALSARRYRERHPEYIQRSAQQSRITSVQRQARYRERHPERIRAQYQRQMSENPDFARIRSAASRAKDPDAARAYWALWRKNNSAKVRFYARTRQATVLQRTPSWANLDKIAAFYEACPPGYEVDHVIPLRGKNVSGLHVENNLQYLTPKENRSKQAKFAVY